MDSKIIWSFNGYELAKIDFENLRGADGFKEATVSIGEANIKVAV